MNLHHKLRTLQQQHGSGPTASATPSVREQLDRLGERRGDRPVAGTAGRSVTDEQTLANDIGGGLRAPGFIQLDRRYDEHHQHGRLCVAPASQLALQELAATPLTSHARVIYMDTETTGLSGGSGTLVFQLGLAWFDSGGKLLVRQYLLSGFRGEQAMLRQVSQDLQGAECLVSFNGKSFDAPLLASRYRLNGLADPFADLLHIDLLHPLRRAFARQWPDCRLQSAERRLLNFQRKQDLPGSEAPAAWFDWIRQHNATRLPGVLQHNRLDTLSLVVLPAALREVSQDPLAHAADVLAIARHLLRRGRESAAYGLLNRYASRLPASAELELARLARRRQNHAQAIDIWQRLAADDNLQAQEQLAKYSEHRSHDLHAALRWTRHLLAAEPDCERHQLRHLRLTRKLVARPSGRKTG